MREIEKEKASLWQVAKAVFWSFAGVRKKVIWKKMQK